MAKATYDPRMRELLLNSLSTLEQQLATSGDEKELLTLYIRLLYECGSWCVQAAAQGITYQEGDLHDLGISYLVASHRLSVQFATGQYLATAMLRTLLDGDETSWPEPYLSPLLGVRS
jgi:hypothetical protein